jgi:hypothetical protein
MVCTFRSLSFASSYARFLDWKATSALDDNTPQEIGVLAKGSNNSTQHFRRARHHEPPEWPESDVDACS